MDTFLESLKQSANSSALYFNNLESTLEQREKDLKQFNEYNSTLTKQYNEKVELLYVLDTCQKYSQDEDNRYSDVNGQLSDSPGISLFVCIINSRSGRRTGSLNSCGSHRRCHQQQRSTSFWTYALPSYSWQLSCSYESNSTSFDWSW